MNKEILSVGFRELSKEIKKLNDEDIAKIVGGQAELKLQIVDKTKILSQTTISNVEINVEITDIALKLNSMTSNEEGMELLKKRCKVKADLQMLAQHLDIPFMTKDTISQLTEKIIESTIGYRTRAAAIQNQ